MNDIRPPKKPIPPRQQQVRPVKDEQTPSSPLNINQIRSQENSLPIITPVMSGLSNSKKRRPIWLVVTLIVLAVIFTSIVIVIGWYFVQLQPVNAASKKSVTIDIKSGSSTQVIGNQLKQEKLIKDTTVFNVYLRLFARSDRPQAGKHVLSPNMDVPTIVSRLASAEADEISITFLPGASIRQHKEVLEKAGYSKSEVDAAFNKTYDSPVLASKPKDASLEGYIYGETYRFSSGASVEDIINRTLSELNRVVNKNNLVQRYQAKQLTLHQGITLASIIQREEREFSLQQRVSQIFNLRLAKGMPLGSDPTYQYASDELGVERDPNIDSPYNTRRVVGLPPGPIASAGENALIAVVEPAEGDYLYFLSGDDNKLYLGKTLEEHEDNIRKYCTEKCKIL